MAHTEPQNDVDIRPVILRQNASVWARFSPWIRNSTLAVTDQALISASNFLVSLLLARWLEPKQYGAYALTFSAYLLLYSCFQALIIEPFCVFGAAEYEQQYRTYLGALGRLQAVVSLACVVVLGTLALVCATVPRFYWAFSAMAGLVIASPLLLAFTLARAATYVVLSPREAVRAGAIYCGVLLASLACVTYTGALSAGTAFLVMGFASAVVTVRLVSKMRPLWSSTEFSLGRVVRKHWSFGCWELAKVGSDWVCENICYMIAGAVLGVSEVGTLKALTTLFLPLNQTLTALRRIFLPHLARKFLHKGDDATRESVKLLTLLYLSGAVVYGVAATILAPRLVPLLYRNKFPAIVGLVPWFAGLLLFSIPVHALDMGLRAVRLPKAIFRSSVMAATAQVLVPLPLARLFGLRGLIVGNVVSGVIFLTTMTRSLRKLDPVLSGASAKT
jgi:O-antigen/teichoic acid export membrane protein